MVVISLDSIPVHVDLMRRALEKAAQIRSVRAIFEDINPEYVEFKTAVLVKDYEAIMGRLLNELIKLK